MASKAGEVLRDFKKKYPKQHKATGMLYSGKYTATATGRIQFHLILISDEGEFELTHVTVNHPTEKKTPGQWYAWLQKYGAKIVINVIEDREKQTGMQWKVRSNLGWSNAARRKRTKISKRKRHNTKKARK